MDIVFKGRHTDVLEKFRKHAIAKLAKIEKLDHKAIRVDVEVTTEHNPRQADRKERVELTITTRGPAIRAEAAAEDRFAALDLALAKLESRLRRACDRRKTRHSAAAARPADRAIERDSDRIETAELLDDLSAAAADAVPAGSVPMSRPSAGDQPRAASNGTSAASRAETVGVDDVVAIEMQGDGPLIVRQKFHVSTPMTIDQALFEMELIGHDFYLFTDATDGLPSVAYRRRGYQYGVIRLVGDVAAVAASRSGGLANEHSQQPANLR